MRLFVRFEEEVYVVGKNGNEEEGVIIDGYKGEFVDFFKREWGFIREEGDYNRSLLFVGKEDNKEERRMVENLESIWEELEGNVIEEINIVYVGGYVNSYGEK